MPSIYDIDPGDLIVEVAKELRSQKAVVPPQWTAFVKTGVNRERQPADPEWWYTRAAAVLRTVRLRGPIGVSKLRTKYGGKKDRGVVAERFYKGSGSIARKILQQLESSELVKQASKGVHKGRVITPKGQSLLDKAAIGLIKNLPKQVNEVMKISLPGFRKPKKAIPKKSDISKKPKVEKPVKAEEKSAKPEPKAKNDDQSKKESAEKPVSLATEVKPQEKKETKPPAEKSTPKEETPKDEQKADEPPKGQKKEADAPAKKDG